MIRGPKKSANFPNISKNPKYSLDSFFGDQLTEVRTGKSLNTTLTHTDENCKDPEVECTVEQIAIKADAAVDQRINILIIRIDPKRSASFPSSEIAHGKATICVRRSARIIWVESMPTSPP